ncbi:MAG: hypothetical protein ACPG8V_00500 [Alphaproteobacteria bacterium]
MKKSLLISLSAHLLLMLMFVGINFIFPKTVEVPPRVVMDVALAVDKGAKAKKTKVKKQKKKPAQKKKKEPKKVKKKVVKKKPKPQKKKQVKKKIKKPVLKAKQKSKTKAKKEIKSKKVLKDLKPKKKVISENDTKKTTVKKKDKSKKVINDVKKSPNVSKTNSNLDGKLTKDDLIELRNQIKQCWKVPAGIQNAENLVTKVKVALKPNGKIINAEIYSTSISTSNQFMRVMSESALRAILSDGCNPLKLPKSKYKQWKNIIITFDPKQMLN